MAKEKTNEIKGLIELGKERGYLTYEDINEALPDDVVSAVPGIRQLDAISVFDSEAFKQGMSSGYQLTGKLMSLIPVVRMIAQYHRYAF